MSTSTREPQIHMSRYSAAGVDTEGAQSALKGLLTPLRRTFGLRPGAGRPVLRFGLFANILEIGHGVGLAVSIDGVGTKALVAQMMEKYDTIGIDCVAMNVNDVICVGAEPWAMLDYIAIQAADKAVFEQIGAGLEEGARQSGITIPGGEVAQIGEMLAGYKEGLGFDLVGCSVGTVPMDHIIVGRDIEEGDTVIGLRSSGIHSNGLSLARRALLKAGMNIDSYIPDLSRTLGEELLEPTRIYVKPVLEMLEAGLAVKALIHVTSDGFMNLARIEADYGFVLEELPTAPAIFDLIQHSGEISAEEMYQVYNMGVGFCVVLSPSDADAALQTISRYAIGASRLGYAVADERRRVHLKSVGLVGEGTVFTKA